jgi:hypothetical protein
VPVSASMSALSDSYDRHVSTLLLRPRRLLDYTTIALPVGME